MTETASTWIHLSPEGPSPEFVGSADEPRRSQERQRARSKVLIVDDEKLIADTIAELLMDAGFEVAVAYDGWKALELAAAFGPDHLLSDVVMPGMNGTELAIAALKMYPTIKILLFTRQLGISTLIEHAANQGFRFDVVSKPIHPRKLIERIREQD